MLELPNVGPATALDLVKLGISEPDELIGGDPDAMYEKLCAIDGVRHDPCARDVFASVVAYANGARARPWWAYTPERKSRSEHGLSLDRNAERAGFHDEPDPRPGT